MGYFSRKDEMQLQNYFPFDSIRPLQIDSMQRIDKAYEEGKRFVILEAPTGFGKSPVVFAVAKKYGPSHVMTPQKILQKQYVRDFQEHMFVMKGKGNFFCEDLDIYCGSKDCKPPAVICGGNVVDTTGNATGEITSDDQLREWYSDDGHPDEIKFDRNEFFYKTRRYKIDACEYKKHLVASRISEITLHNFHSFIYQACFSPFPAHEARKMLIVDEAHNIENVCMDSFHINLSNKLFNNEKFPAFRKLEDVIKYFDEDNYVSRIEKTKKSLNMQGFTYERGTRMTYLVLLRKYYEFNNDTKLMREYDMLIGKVDRFIRYFYQKIEFVFEYSENKGEQKVEIKPVYIAFWMPTLFNKGERIFLTSATILDKNIFCENLGIPIEETEFIQMPSEFPKKNRKVWGLPIGSMTQKNIDASLPKVVKYAEEIIKSKSYRDKKGIIHTHTFKIANYIRDHIKSKRLLFVEDFRNREEMIDHHFESENTILVAPALHEGLDLKDEHGRFQIIMKVPYPSLVDIQIKERTSIRKEWDWYSWLAALKLVQSYGRCVRHKKDWAETYILDKKFIDFAYSATTRRFLPNWFLEAVRIRR
jgi:Rad3-related DNA helicase